MCIRDRWSYERERGSISLSFFSLVRETPNIATSGGFIIGVKKEPPIPPKLEIVNVPPFSSFGVSFLLRALSLTSISSYDISNTLFLSTSLITGTTKPFSVLTAMPI